MATTLKRFLAANGISQADVARGIQRTTAYISFLANGDTGASQETISLLLAFLSRELGRQVAYEELFPAEDFTTEPAPQAAGGSK